MKAIRSILFIASVVIVSILAFILSCSKTTILNKVEQEDEQTETKSDTTTRNVPQMQEDSLHEITFQPMIEAWVISQGDTLKV